MANLEKNILFRDLNQQAYLPVWERMKQFTDQRTPNTLDELWLVDHFPVFTQGQSGKPEHVLKPGNIPVVQTDRGGQVTYHGPGQLVLYCLIDLRRRQLGVRQFVHDIENAVIQLLQCYGISANTREDAPGVYVDGAKICSIGLRVRRGCSYHGLAFNHHMDLSPFLRINPCGFKALPMVQLSELGVAISRDALAHQLMHHLKLILGYNTLIKTENTLPIIQDNEHV